MVETIRREVGERLAGVDSGAKSLRVWVEGEKP